MKPNNEKEEKLTCYENKPSGRQKTGKRRRLLQSDGRLQEPAEIKVATFRL